MADELDDETVEQTTASGMEEQKEVPETPQEEKENDNVHEEETRQCELQCERDDDPQPPTIEGENDSDGFDPSAIGIEEIDDEDKSFSREPWSILRKGAVAAVGGTMVGVGLVMIPLPTPFGAVIASSGLAVLGTEFDGAAKMNDKLVGAATEQLETARDHVIRRIERMEKEDDDDDDNGDESLQPQRPKATHRATKDFVVRRTGSLLSKTILPFLKRKEQGDQPSATTSVDNSWEPLEDEDDNAEAVLTETKNEDDLDGTFVIVRENEIDAAH